MGHSNSNTTSIYLAYALDPGSALEIADRAFSGPPESARPGILGRNHGASQTLSPVFGSDE
jgi:hypothetical protein